MDERDGFRCVCAVGYSGRRCDVDVDDCRRLRGPCLNHGVCVDELDAFTCRCQPGYSGTVCQLRADQCHGSDCVVNGVVKNAAASLTSSGGGAVIDCRSSPCMNGATCVDVRDSVSGRGFRCVCRRQYRGRRCSVRQIVRRRHSKQHSTSVVTLTFQHDNISTPPSPVHVVSSTERPAPGGVSSAAAHNLIVVLSPMVPFVVVVAVAVVAAVLLTAGTAVCLCCRRRRHSAALPPPRHHDAEWIHNNVRRQKNNASNLFKNAAPGR